MSRPSLPCFPNSDSYGVTLAPGFREVMWNGSESESPSYRSASGGFELGRQAKRSARVDVPFPELPSDADTEPEGQLYHLGHEVSNLFSLPDSWTLQVPLGRPRFMGRPQVWSLFLPIHSGSESCTVKTVSCSSWLVSCD